MKPCRRWVHGVAGCCLLLGMLSASGCVRYLHPVEPFSHDVVACCKPPLPCCCSHVYIFMVHGLDPLDYANLTGVRDHLHSLGYRKTYYGQLYHKKKFEDEIRRLHQDDPEARFVLIGFSLGANVVRSISNNIHEEGICVDLLVYLGGNTLENTEEDQPANAAKIVNILASGCIWNGAWMDRAENLHETDVYHFGSPTHPSTLDVLARELAVVGNQVPIIEVVSPAVIAGEPGAPPPVNKPDGEWGFLKLRSDLAAAAVAWESKQVNTSPAPR